MGDIKLQAIIDGVGIGANESTAKDVVECYGDGFRLVDHSRYSKEMAYDITGLSFFYKWADERKVIFYICVESPYRGETTNGGIVLGEHTMCDVIRLYGSPTWRTSNGSATWFTEYAGIEFHVEKERDIPESPFNEPVHIAKPIVKVGVKKKIEVKPPTVTCEERGTEILEGAKVYDINQVATSSVIAESSPSFAQSAPKKSSSADSNSGNWILLLIALGFGGCMYLSERAHQRYLKNTSPEQQAIDRDEMARQDAEDDRRFRHARGR